MMHFTPLRKPTVGKRWAFLYLTLTIGTAVAQNIVSSQNVTYSHGTCIVIAWRDGNMAVAADSRSVMVVHRTSQSSFSEDQRSLIGPDQCKLRRPSPQLLLAVDGLSKIFESGNNKVVWDGLDVANRIFKEGSTPSSESQLLSEAKLWQDTFQKCVDDGMVSPPKGAKDSVVVALHVLANIDGTPVTIHARFMAAAGTIISIAPYYVPPPHRGAIKVIKYGSCNLHLGVNAPHSDLTAEENNRYTALKKMGQATALSDTQLRTLAADYVDLASSISARLATGDEPADVAPPFTTASFDIQTSQWKVDRLGACAKYLSPESGHRSKNLRIGMTQKR